MHEEPVARSIHRYKLIRNGVSSYFEIKYYRVDRLSRDDPKNVKNSKMVHFQDF